MTLPTSVNGSGERVSQTCTLKTQPPRNHTFFVTVTPVVPPATGRRRRAAPGWLYRAVSAVHVAHDSSSAVTSTSRRHTAVRVLAPPVSNPVTVRSVPDSTTPYLPLPSRVRAAPSSSAGR